MFSPWVRLLLITAGLGIGIHHIERGDALGWLPLAAAALLVYGYFRYGTVQWAFQAYKRADMERVRRRLAHTPFPKILAAQSRAYHHWLSGVIALTDGDLDTARRRLTLAVGGNLRTPRNHASVALVLASVEREAGNEDAARRWAGESRRLWRSEETEEVFASLGLEEE